MGKAGSGTRSTTTKAPPRKKRSSAGPPVPVRFNQSCLLLAFESTRSAKEVLESILLCLVGFSNCRWGGAEWYAFAGTSPHHWKGYTTWVAVSVPAMQAVGGFVQHMLDSEHIDFDASELCNPAREPHLMPVLRVGDDGAQVLDGCPWSAKELYQTIVDAVQECPTTVTERTWRRED